MAHYMSYFNGSKSAKDNEEENNVTMRRRIKGGKDGLDRQWEQ